MGVQEVMHPHFCECRHKGEPFLALPASCMMMKPDPDELKLAIRARSGDQEALVELIERLRVGLFALAYAEREYRPPNTPFNPSVPRLS